MIMMVIFVFSHVHVFPMHDTPVVNVDAIVIVPQVLKDFMVVMREERGSLILRTLRMNAGLELGL